ncbi:hypothetical protein HS7_17340 [Sulfolobales archaeon HS-7]|nr:hypothetical protein HS7_17340 [Sulfolobales archaeon HS-7]
MKGIILGGGIAGLLVAEKLNYPIIESNPRVGGTFSQEINDITLQMPCVVGKECANYLSQYDIPSVEIDILPMYRKIEHFQEKVGFNLLRLEEVEWLSKFTSKKLYIVYLKDFVNKLTRNKRIIKSRLSMIKDNVVRLSNGMTFDTPEIVNASSRKALASILALDLGKLGSILAAVFAIATKKENVDWNLMLNGARGDLFSIVLRDNRGKEYDLYFVYSFFNSALSFPSNFRDRIYSNLKRRRVLLREKVIADRLLIFNEGIVFGELPMDDFIHVGRLGLWKNFDICSTIKSVDVVG